MKRLLVPATFVAMALTAQPARAETVLLKDLLATGFQIVGTDVISKELAVSMSGQTGWTDVFMITLQRAGEIAFCHMALNATRANDAVMEHVCFRPVATMPAPAAEPATPAPAEAPASAPSAPAN